MGGIYNLRSMPGEIVLANDKIVYRRKRLSDAEMLDNIFKEEVEV